MVDNFWSQIWGFLFSREALRHGKIESASFKYDYSFLNKSIVGP